MKKIGILFGQENTFPQAFVDRVNSTNESGITAEFLNINKVVQGEPSGYDVIIDRISQDVPCISLQLFCSRLFSIYCPFTFFVVYLLVYLE